MSVMDTPLAEQEAQYWSNSILYRLGIAMGWVAPGELFTVDPDTLLEAVEARIEGKDAE